MKRFVLSLVAGALAAATLPVSQALAAEKVTMRTISADGIGKKIGTVTLADGESGLVITPKLKNLPPGPHGFHVHAKGDCNAAPKDGVPTAGQAAGGHYDPANTGKHEGPLGQGHRGDLPVLVVDADGRATQVLTASTLKLADLAGKAIMIHEGGDNYADQPKPLGGGGARIACGVVK